MHPTKIKSCATELKISLSEGQEMTKEKLKEKVYELWAFRYGWEDMEMPDHICEGTKKECKEARKHIPWDEYHRSKIEEKWIEDD